MTRNPEESQQTGDARTQAHTHTHRQHVTVEAETEGLRLSVKELPETWMRSEGLAPTGCRDRTVLLIP